MELLESDHLETPGDRLKCIWASTIIAGGRKKMHRDEVQLRRRQTQQMHLEELSQKNEVQKVQSVEAGRSLERLRPVREGLLDAQMHLKQRELSAEADLTRVIQERQHLETLRKLFMDEVKNKFTAYLSAKEFYKSRLNMYYTIEEFPETNETEVFVEFFKTKKSKVHNYSLTLRKNNDGHYKLVGMKPVLSIFDQLVQRLVDTHDLPKLLSCVRRCYKIYHSVKDLQ